MAIFNYYNAPGRRVPTGAFVNSRRSGFDRTNRAQFKAPVMLSKANFSARPALAKGVQAGQVKNNVPARPLRGGSMIGRALSPTIVKTGAPARKFGRTG